MNEEKMCGKVEMTNKSGAWQMTQTGIVFIPDGEFHGESRSVHKHEVAMLVQFAKRHSFNAIKWDRTKFLSRKDELFGMMWKIPVEILMRIPQDVNYVLWKDDGKRIALVVIDGKMRYGLYAMQVISGRWKIRGKSMSSFMKFVKDMERR